ncbi:hypothetical protein RRG08_038420, partial [Elysia crispata]
FSSQRSHNYLEALLGIRQFCVGSQRAAVSPSPHTSGLSLTGRAWCRSISFWRFVISKRWSVRQIISTKAVWGERGFDIVSMSIGSVEFTSHYSEIYCASSIILFLTATSVNR